MLGIMGVTLTVTVDDEGHHLRVRGNPVLVQAAAPMLRQHRDALIAHLLTRMTLDAAA